MKGVQCYELFGGIALKNHAFSFSLSAKIPTHLYDHNYYNAHNMFLAPFEHLHDHNYCIKQDKNILTDYIIDQ